MEGRGAWYLLIHVVVRKEETRLFVYKYTDMYNTLILTLYN
jgi:hypothetical protein